MAEPEIKQENKNEEPEQLEGSTRPKFDEAETEIKNEEPEQLVTCIRPNFDEAETEIKNEEPEKLEACTRPKFDEAESERKEEEKSKPLIKESETEKKVAEPKPLGICSTGARPKTKDGESKPLDTCSTGARPKTDIAARQSRRTEMITKKLKKKAAKMEQRDERNYDNIMKIITSFSAEDKFGFLSEKYRQLYQEVRRFEIEHLRFTQLQIEHEQLNNDYGKTLLARSRLENLCRDLQKQNKEIKEETSQKLLEEEERRREVSTKFQVSFQELSTMMEDSNKKSYKLHDDNVEMTKKIQYLCEKSLETEGQMALMKRETELEKQLSVSNLAKVRLEAQMEKQQWEQERKVLELNLKKSEEVRTQLQMNAKVLQEQIQLYAKKCEDCEKTIRKSNKMFEKCKAETHGVTKKMFAMENDAKTWKTEWLKRDEEAESGKRKIGQLEKLCRQLQTERNEFLKLLRANNIAIPSVNVADSQEPIILPPAPPIASAKERELAVLKNKLAELKDDLEGLDINDKTEAVKETSEDGGSSTVKNGKNPAVESTDDQVDSKKGAED